VLPMAFRLTRYEGVDQVKGRERFSLEYGPILMAALDTADAAVVLDGGSSPLDLVKRLQPIPDRPLHFTAPVPFPGFFPHATWVPYFEISAEHFTCVPVIETRSVFL